MTHDELLLDVSEVHNWYQDQERFTEVVPYLLALQKVVELHKPIKNIWITHPNLLACDECSEWTNKGPGAIEYPCPTIQAIKKELK